MLAAECEKNVNVHLEIRDSTFFAITLRIGLAKEVL